MVVHQQHERKEYQDTPSPLAYAAKDLTADRNIDRFEAVANIRFLLASLVDVLHSNMNIAYDTPDDNLELVNWAKHVCTDEANKWPR